MKKQIIVSLLMIFFSSFIFPDTFGKKVYKPVLINNEKVYRWVKLIEISKYNRNGKEIYKKTTYNEEWKEYNNEGYLIHSKSSGGSETWKEYDEKGNLIHFKFEDGYEEWIEYDDDGYIEHDDIWHDQSTDNGFCECGELEDMRYDI